MTIAALGRRRRTHNIGDIEHGQDDAELVVGILAKDAEEALELCVSGIATVEAGGRDQTCTKPILWTYKAERYSRAVSGRIRACNKSQQTLSLQFPYIKLQKNAALGLAVLLVEGSVEVKVVPQLRVIDSLLLFVVRGHCC